MILEIGACYQVVSTDYGIVDHKAQHDPENDLFYNDILLVLEHVNNIKKPNASKITGVDLFYHYKILIDNKIKYIVVLAKHDTIDHYLKKIT